MLQSINKPQLLVSVEGAPKILLPRVPIFVDRSLPTLLHKDIFHHPLYSINLTPSVHSLDEVVFSCNQVLCKRDFKQVLGQVLVYAYLLC